MHKTVWVVLALLILGVTLAWWGQPDNQAPAPLAPTSEGIATSTDLHRRPPGEGIAIYTDLTIAPGERGY